MNNFYKNSWTIFISSVTFFVLAIEQSLSENYMLAFLMLAVSVVELICGIVERNNEKKALDEGVNK